MQPAAGDPSKPFRSKDIVGRLARGVSIDAARAELLARWPSIQSATLPAALPEADREALLRQRLNVAPLASGYSGLRSPVRHHALGAPGPDGDSSGGRERQPCGPDPGALADAAPPGRDSPRTGRQSAARVPAAAGRRDPAVGRGVRGCGPAGVGDRPSRCGIPHGRPHDFEVSDGHARCRRACRHGTAHRKHRPRDWRRVRVAVGRGAYRRRACALAGGSSARWDASGAACSWPRSRCR